MPFKMSSANQNFIQENAFHHVICKLSAILLKSQWRSPQRVSKNPQINGLVQNYGNSSILLGLICTDIVIILMVMYNICNGNMPQTQMQHCSYHGQYNPHNGMIKYDRALMSGGSRKTSVRELLIKWLCWSLHWSSNSLPGKDMKLSTENKRLSGWLSWW